MTFRKCGGRRMKLMLVDDVEKHATKFINVARMVQRFEATVLILNAEKLQ